VNDASLDTTFAALADPTRRAILQRLMRAPASVGEVAAPFGMSLPAISKHLTVLEGARLIVRQRDAQRRICRLAPAPLADAADWIEQYRRFWEQKLDNLADYLAQLQEDTPHGDRTTRRTAQAGARSRSKPAKR
jgi:DNA-binding transcriptional ArsR family regulator